MNIEINIRIVFNGATVQRCATRLQSQQITLRVHWCGTSHDVINRKRKITFPLLLVYYNKKYPNTCSFIPYVLDTRRLTTDWVQAYSAYIWKQFYWTPSKLHNSRFNLLHHAMQCKTHRTGLTYPSGRVSNNQNAVGNTCVVVSQK